MTRAYPAQVALRDWLEDVFYVAHSHRHELTDREVRVGMALLGARLTRAALDVARSVREEYSYVPRRTVRAMEALLVRDPFGQAEDRGWTFVAPQSWARRPTFEYAVDAAMQYRAMGFAMVAPRNSWRTRYEDALDRMYGLIVSVGIALGAEDRESAARTGLVLARTALRDLGRQGLVR